MRISKKAVLYSAAILGASGAVVQGLSFVYRILLSRVLGAEGMGVYQLVFPVYTMFVAIAMSGIGVGTTSITASQQATGDAGGNRKLIRLSLMLFIVLFFTLAIPTFLFLDFITKSIIGDERTRLGLLVMLPCIFFTGFENIYKAYFHGIRKVQFPAISDQCELFIRIGFVALLLYVIKPQNTVNAVAFVILGMLLSEIFSSTFLAGLYRRDIRNKSKTARTKNGTLLLLLARIAIPAALTGIVHNLFHSANTLLLPRRLMMAGSSRSDAVSTIGVVFGMATPLMMLPMAVTGPISAIILPKISEGLALNNLKDVRRKIGKALQAISLMVVPFMLLLIPLSPTLLNLIFHEQISEGSFALLALSGIMTCYHMVLSTTLNAIGMPRRNLINGVVGGCIQLFFTYYVAALPQWGIYGALWGGVLGSFVTNLIALHTVVKKVKLNVRWMRWFLLPAVSALVAGLFCRLMFLWLSIYRVAGLSSLLLSFMLGGFVFLIALWMQGVHFFRYVKVLMR